MADNAVTLQGTPVFVPTKKAERISSLDILRGIALLGILPMNIVAMGLYSRAYIDPTVSGGAEGLNLWAYILNAFLFDGKMRGIFSILFGAGVILLTSRAEKAGRGGEIADIYYRRIIWLLLFGVAHAFLLWGGDILYLYALMGLLLFPLRKLQPKPLIALAVLFAVGASMYFVYESHHATSTKQAALEAKAAESSGATLTFLQKNAIDSWNRELGALKPSPEQIRHEEGLFRSGFWGAVEGRTPLVMYFHSMTYWSPHHWDMLCMMIFGMAFFKLGILSAKRTYGFYLVMAACGYAIGIPITILQLRPVIGSGFDVIAIANAERLYEPARIAICFGHVGLLLAIIKSGLPRFLSRSFAAVGQMALSNYILHSVLTVFVFTGLGLGLYGQLERHQLYFVVIPIWIVNLVWSPLWLRHFRFGPLEWLWRSLTYWKRQPMRRVEMLTVPEPAVATGD